MQPLFRELLAIYPHLPDWWGIMWQEGWIICLYQGSTDWVCLPFYSNIFCPPKKEKRWKGMMAPLQAHRVGCSTPTLLSFTSVSLRCFSDILFSSFFLSRTPPVLILASFFSQFSLSRLERSVSSFIIGHRLECKVRAVCRNWLLGAKVLINEKLFLEAWKCETFLLKYGEKYR